MDTRLIIISLESGYASGTYTVNMTDIRADKTVSIKVPVS